MTTTQRPKASFNDFGKAGPRAEPPEKDLGLDWDAIRTAYESRLDWEEANGLNPVERQAKIPETEKPAPVKRGVKQGVKQGVKRKPKPRPKPRPRPLDNPNRRTADRTRILELHKQGMNNTQIAKVIKFSPQVVSSILTQEFGIYAERSKMCGAGLHSMDEFGEQKYVTKPDGSKVKNGRVCTACLREKRKIANQPVPEFKNGKRVPRRPGGPKPKIDHDRIFELHNQGMKNAHIASEMGISQQAVSAILIRVFGIHTRESSKRLCRAGLHSMEEFGVQQYRPKPGGPPGVKIKAGRYCSECRRLRRNKK